MVAGDLDPELKAELKEICAEREADCYFLGDQFVVLADPRAESFDVFGLYGCYTDLRLKVLGSYQRANAAVAVAAVELFDGAELDGDAVRTALASTAVPGPPGGHQHPAALHLRRLAQPSGHGGDHALARPDPGAAQADRRGLRAAGQGGPGDDAGTWCPRCDIIFATQSSSSRALPADELAAIIAKVGKGPEVFVDPDPRSAMVSAYRLATSNQVVLVTGSLTLISDLKRGLS